MSGKPLRDATPIVCVMLFFAAVVFLMGHCLAGCKPADFAEHPPLPEYCYDEELLRAKVFACVASAETKAESQACRKQSLKTCGIEMTP